MSTTEKTATTEEATTTEKPPKAGRPPEAEKTVSIPYTYDILLSANISPSELADLARFSVAAKLFEEGRLTMGQAAKFYGQSRMQFMTTLVQRGYSCVNLTEDEAEDDIRFGYED